MLAIGIFNITFKHNIKFDVPLIPRKSNELADIFSKTINYDDRYVTPDIFKMLIVRRWRQAKIDRFVFEKNQKTMRFSSKYVCSFFFFTRRCVCLQLERRI